MICSPPLYEYEHDGRVWLFEFSAFSGPWPVRKDGTLYKRAGAKFYAAYEAWAAEPDREQYRVGGGCVSFTA